MLRLKTLVFQYYATLWLYNIAFTICFIVLTGFGMGFDPVSLFYCKLFGFLSAALLHYYTSPFTYFYYRNAGMPVRRLLIYSAVLDFTASLLIIIPVIILFHVHA